MYNSFVLDPMGAINIAEGYWDGWGEGGGLG